MRNNLHATFNKTNKKVTYINYILVEPQTNFSVCYFSLVKECFSPSTLLISYMQCIQPWFVFSVHIVCIFSHLKLTSCSQCAVSATFI